MLLLSCDDQPGIVAAVADFVFRHGGNVVHADQHIDRESGQFFRLYIAQRFPEGTPQQQRKQQRQCDQYRTRIVKLAALFEEAMQKGEIRRTDAYRLALFFAEGANAIIVERVMEENSPPAEDDVDLIVSMFLDGIRIQRS